MKHPLFSSKPIFGFYLLAWVLLFGIQTLAFIQLFAIDWYHAFIDNLVFGVVFFLLGFGSWYFIRFTSLEKKQFSSLFVEHLAYSFVLVSIWVFGSTYLLSTIFSASTEYIQLIWRIIEWRYLIGFLLYLVMLVVFYLHQNHQKQLQRSERESQLLANLQNAEIDLLRSKLNPHFLFNSLNSLNALIQTDTEKASFMLVQLSDFLRFSIEKDKQERLSLEDEIKNLDRYIAIERIRFGNRLNYIKEISEQALHLKLPAMLLQPLVENAIKYGIGSKLDDVEIKITANQQSDYLVLELMNDFDKSVIVRKGSGNGLDNVRKRLEMIYNSSAVFKIEDTGSLFKVILQIPQNQ